MGKRNMPSTIDKLPPEIREMINRLRIEKGFSIDAILAKLQEMDVEVSRSALGRHVRGLAEVSEKMRRAREITETLARMGNRADNKMMRGTIELLNSMLLEISLAEEEGEDGQFRPIQFGPLQVKALAQTAESLARAEKIDTDREKAIKEEGRREASAEARKKLEAAGKSGDIDPEALGRAKRILGFD